jgi:RNA polymerase sigma factor (sigma-70 family)
LHHSNDSSDPATLLDHFVKSKRSEPAFAALVQRLSGLVYSSALRRTDSPQLAEEIMQNVFAIMARKADKLRHHPSLTAWIFETTRLEAEKRRQRKHAALASEANAHHPVSSYNTDDEAAWKDAVPLLDEVLDRLPQKDRQVILQRFYEDKKISEIAKKTSKSEAACKMRIQRALKKISTFLTSRGVALSATAIASALSAELARSAPAQAIAAITPKALAASTTITATTLVTNTVQTMSTIKTISLTSAAVLVIASAPFLVQQSKANKLSTQLSELESERTVLEQESAKALQAWKDQQNKATSAESAPRTIRDLLAASDEPINAESLLKELMQVMMSQDMMGMLKIFIPIANLSPDEYNKLIDEIQDSKTNDQMKMMAMQILGSFAPDTNPAESLERMMQMELEPYSYANIINQWATTDPDAALAWYQKKLEAGELLGKGVHNTPEETLMAMLISGVAQNDPARAIKLYQSQIDKGASDNALSQLAGALSMQMKKSGDDTYFRQLLESGDKANRKHVLSSSIGVVSSNGKFDEGLAHIDKYNMNPDARGDLMISMLTNNQSVPVAKQGDWLLANTAPAQAPDVVKNLVNHLAWQGLGEIADWVTSQTPGPVRDSGLDAVVSSRLNQSAFDAAFADAQNISDQTIRDKAVNKVAQRWLSQNPDEAKAALPADVIEALTNK